MKYYSRQKIKIFCLRGFLFFNYLHFSDLWYDSNYMPSDKAKGLYETQGSMRVLLILSTNELEIFWSQSMENNQCHQNFLLLWDFYYSACDLWCKSILTNIKSCLLMRVTIQKFTNARFHCKYMHFKKLDDEAGRIS